MRLLAFAFTIVFVWTGPMSDCLPGCCVNYSLRYACGYLACRNSSIKEVNFRVFNPRVSEAVLFPYNLPSQREE